MAILEANSGAKILKEVEERKSREANLVFYGIPEGAGERAEVRREEDEKRVNLGLQEIGMISGYEVKFSRRIGEKLERHEARPLLVGFESVQTSEAILERANRLSRSTHEGLREVTIVPDLTMKQRKDEQEKIVEVKKKNLTRSIDERSKNLFYKVVGRKDSRSEILASLLPGENMDKEGLVVRGTEERGRRGNRLQGATQFL